MIAFGSLFAGIGGFDLGLERAGMECKWEVEIDDFCNRVLEKHWPHVRRYRDVREFGLEDTWNKYVLNVKTQARLQGDPIASRAELSEPPLGDLPTERRTEKRGENTPEERRMRSSLITAEDVSVAESLRWNFSLLTINSIMEMQREGYINHKHGNLLLSAGCPTIIKSSAITAITQKHITAYAHTLKELQVDVVTGGVPCQPASVAGKQRGKEDHRWLWPEALRVIREIHPTWAILENVSGLTALEGGLVFEQVLLELESYGYQIQTFDIPACAVDAPHVRHRIWIVANAKRGGCGEIWKRGGVEGVRGRGPNDSMPVAESSPQQCGAESIQSELSSAECGRRWLTEPNVGRVAHGIPRRVDRLRSLGNAVVPQVVEIIGRAIMEVAK